MTNKIPQLFATKKKNLLSVFYTAGFPHLDSTVAIAVFLEEAGADLIEIGIPFSDPVADGPVIQESNEIALDNGMTLKLLLEQVRTIRQTVKLPIILMGYINPVLQYGFERFCKEAAESGVDGLILPDLPMDEYLTEYKAITGKYNLTNTFLMSPTTSEERIRKIDASTEGFIYAVSASSITGGRGEFSAEQEAYFKRIKAMKLRNPFLIGFGISNHSTFEKVAQYSSGAIVGSAFITVLKTSNDLKSDIRSFINKIKN